MALGVKPKPPLEAPVKELVAPAALGGSAVERAKQKPLPGIIAHTLAVSVSPKGSVEPRPTDAT